MIIETIYLQSTPIEMEKIEETLKKYIQPLLSLGYSTSFQSQYNSGNPLGLHLHTPSDPPERKLSSIKIIIEREPDSPRGIPTEDELDDKIFSLILHAMSEHKNIEYFSLLEFPKFIPNIQE